MEKVREIGHNFTTVVNTALSGAAANLDAFANSNGDAEYGELKESLNPHTTKIYVSRYRFDKKVVLMIYSMGFFYIFFSILMLFAPFFFHLLRSLCLFMHLVGLVLFTYNSYKTYKREVRAGSWTQGIFLTSQTGDIHIRFDSMYQLTCDFNHLKELFTFNNGMILRDRYESLLSLSWDSCKRELQFSSNSITRLDIVKMFSYKSMKEINVLIIEGWIINQDIHNIHHNHSSSTGTGTGTGTGSNSNHQQHGILDKIIIKQDDMVDDIGKIYDYIHNSTMKMKESIDI